MKIIITESQLNKVMSEMGKPLTDEEKKERLDKIKKLAVGFENPRQFFLKYPEEYYFIRGNDYVDEVFPNRKKYKPEGYWNTETISKEAEKYNSKSEFLRGNQVAYIKATQLGILDMLFPFNLPKGTFSKGAPIKWTLEKSLEHAKNFDGTRSEFTKKYLNAYKILRDNNLWDDIKFKNSTNDERKKLVDLAKDYESPKQMKKLNPELHSNLLKKGLLYKLFDSTKVSFDEKLEKAKRLKEFTDTFTVDFKVFMKFLYKYDFVLWKRFYTDSKYRLALFGEDYFKTYKYIKISRNYKNKYDLYDKNKTLYYKLSKMGVLDKLYQKEPSQLPEYLSV